MADIPAKIDVSPAGAHSQTKGLKPRRGSHTRLNPDGTHPLQTQWKFWYSKKDSKATDYEHTQHVVSNCSTIEEFRSVYSKLKRPSELGKDSNLMLFRDGAVPSWEHFPNGGAFSLHLKRHSLHLNRFWEELLISAIGEGFDSSDVIGIAVHIRPKEESIFIWLKEISHRYQIAGRIRSILSLPSNAPLEFRSNKFNLERRAANLAMKAAQSQTSAAAGAEGEESDGEAEERHE